MSIPSYRRNVSLGVTGQYSPTCLPASLEQISPYHKLDPDIYVDYRRFINHYHKLNKRQWNPAWKVTIDCILEELGGFTHEDVVFERAHTYGEFSRIVRKLIRADFRIVV